MKEQDYTDPALEEIWAIREKIAAEFDFDIHKMARPPPDPQIGHSTPPDAAASGVEIEYDSGSGLEEIWAIMDQLSAEFDHDAEKLGRDYMEYQKRFGDRLVSPPDRKKTRRPAA